MPYPASPFNEDFNLDILTELKDGHQNVGSSVSKCELNAELHSSIPDMIFIRHLDTTQLSLNKFRQEVVVDNDCGAAVLRGSHIYAPGVLGMVAGTQLNDAVSIYVDIEKNCKKGFQKIYEGKKVFIGNGLVKIVRKNLFGENLTPSGIAVHVTETISGCPSIPKDCLPPDWGLLQNTPSIICVLNLGPRQGEVVLDMCAAPGNKTTHIASIMKNQGKIIAIDKTPKKVEQLEKNCIKFGAKVKCFQADSTKILTYENDVSAGIESGPPFSPESFDKILLDVPCSALGKRPQFLNSVSEKVLRSYVPLQKKLFRTAVHLLKVEGTLVYSTCTITLSENEGMVAWALSTFNCLKLISPTHHLGRPGWEGITLSEDERQKVQRFGPEAENPVMDSVGFFIACFRKTCKIKN
ncbi:tRNA (cytosine(72)-C(5))-methyltransferase NSUN6 isoform X2 [Cylas formicarius]|uniref:tRNA (cytosine(72)-C(5))-methyltransferase NSUN6 isoform X2 n=1 Tax=Cylas formicarius TaxID=197179 RepID=UPI002958708F|nr:tRNA (cytosine(72)-C(5))-methyltransferase NSUN6 isoform X2 [Cylas formicarius]